MFWDPATPEGREAVEALIALPVESVARLFGGRNSRVHMVTGSGGRRFAVKSYFLHQDDPRDRRKTEYEALTLLDRSGVSKIPKLVATSREHQFTIFEFIEGAAMAAVAIDDRAIESAVSFLSDLRELARRGGGGFKQPASEAVFSLEALVRNIEERCDRLGEIAEPDEVDLAMLDFLRSDFRAAKSSMVRASRETFLKAGVSPGAPLPQEHKTLSPSDFGFHNAIDSPDGLVFCDFEYFGWDDPAKTVSDFLLHPGMDVPLDQLRLFVAGTLDVFGDDPGFPLRLGEFYPLFGLKWCLILLNEFITRDLMRRRFSRAAEAPDDPRQGQLVKSRSLLDRVLANAAHNPYLAGLKRR